MLVTIYLGCQFPEEDQSINQIKGMLKYCVEIMSINTKLSVFINTNELAF